MLGLLLAIGVNTLRAQCPPNGTNTINWIDTNGNWSDSANWSPNCVPNNTAAAFFNVTIMGTGRDTVTFDAGPTIIDSLTLGNGELLWGTGGSLTVGSSNAVGVLNNSGEIDRELGGTLTLTGDLNNQTSAYTYIGGDRFGDYPASLVVTGNLTNSGSLDVYWEDGSASVGGVVINNGVLGLAHNSTLTAGSFINYGQLISHAGGDVVISGDFTNYGGVDGNLFNITVGGDFNNQNGAATNVWYGNTLGVAGNFNNQYGAITNVLVSYAFSV